MCGENGVSQSLGGAPVGPSPRVRGERVSFALLGVRHPDHPRVCGENPGDDIAAAIALRTIPACAGRTPWPSPFAAGSPDHPRVCGENLCGVSGQQTVNRTIPACAGRTQSSSPSSSSPAGPSPRVRGERSDFRSVIGGPSDHPRVCGENVGNGGGGGGLRRTIPACAGRTRRPAAPPRSPSGPSPRVRGERSAQTATSASRPDHPRVCGENFDRPRCPGGGCRTIPACAGRTSDRPEPVTELVGPSPRVRGELVMLTSAACSSSDHPRVCGENPDAASSAS